MISEDEERGSMFYELEQNELFQSHLPIYNDEPDLALPQEQPFDYVEHYKHVQEENNSLFEEFGFLTGGQRDSFQKFTMHNKSITGLRGMVTLDGQDKRLDAFSSPQDMGLPGFFAQEDSTYPKLIFEKHLLGLSQTYTKIDFNLAQNFDNYLYIQKSNNNQFIQNLKNTYIDTLKALSKKKNPLELFGQIFGFWIECFKNMLQEVEKCSVLYTLNTFKKQKDRSNLMEFEQLPSLAEEEPKQRRSWTTDDMLILNQFMESSVQNMPGKIQKVASQLGRSVLAVQSKMQKLQKQKREKPNDFSLEKKMLMALSKTPSGMGKEQLLARMNSQFEMGDQESWKNSVGQLLSTCKKVTKSKGVFSFVNIPVLEPPNNFKNKVIACLYQLPNQTGNLKAITMKYIQKFQAIEGINLEYTQRIKCIEANIYKTIFKYNVFDKTNSKMVYRYTDSERQSNSESESGNKESSLYF